MLQPYRDRREAGRELARHLRAYGGRSDAIVLALPRGGVPVGFEVARELGLPLDVYIVRKLGMPGQEELALGALASGGVCVLNDEVVRAARIPPQTIDAIAAREEKEIVRRERLYRGDRPSVDVRERTVLLIDDGLATGATMSAAAAALRKLGPRRIVVAVPAAARETCESLASEVDEIVCAMMPEPFYAVGYWYEDFTQTSDEEVQALLAAAQNRRPTATAGPTRPGVAGL
jgi:predicted phosphoribosyltransferase